MTYKDLRNKTIFDFCNDTDILQQVTEFEMPQSRNYVLSFPAVVHAQLLQKLGHITSNKELTEAAIKLEAVLFKEQNRMANKEGLIID